MQNQIPGETAPESAEQLEQARQLRNQRVALVAGVLIAFGAVIAGVTWYSTGGSGTDTSTYSGVSIAEGDASIKIGPSDAPVKVVLFEDFGCAYCGALEQSTTDFLKENAAKGKVQVEYRPISTATGSTYSVRALNAWAAVLKNATPAAALKLHDLLFSNQPVSPTATTPSDADISQLIKRAGGDNAAVRAALEAHDSTYFAMAAKAAVAAGAHTTPTVILDGRRLEGNIDQIVSAIEDRVAAGS